MNIPQVSELLSLKGKVALVTGAGAGIGSAIARRFAEAGARVMVHYRGNEAGALGVAKQITGAGGEARSVQADLKSTAGAQKLVDAAVREFGRLDIAVNNAGTYPLAALVDMTEGEWDEVIAPNLKGVHVLTQVAARQMITAGRGGAIVNLGSIEAQNVAPRHAHYAAAKAGVVMYTRSAASELGRFGIRVNCVSPGLIWKPGLEEAWPEGVAAYKEAAPLGRIGQPEDVADACLFLASQAARWITGAELIVDGGVLTARAY